eukprot:jgi/Botrbrau1/4698/Bobra.0218s0019.1
MLPDLVEMATISRVPCLLLVCVRSCYPFSLTRHPWGNQGCKTTSLMVLHCYPPSASGALTFRSRGSPCQQNLRELQPPPTSPAGGQQQRPMSPARERKPAFCKRCRTAGHLARDCPKAKEDKEMRAKLTLMSHDRPLLLPVGTATWRACCCTHGQCCARTISIQSWNQ